MRTVGRIHLAGRRGEGRPAPRAFAAFLFIIFTFSVGCCYFGRLLVAAFCVLVCLASFLALLSRSLSRSVPVWLAAVALACLLATAGLASQRSKGSALRKRAATRSGPARLTDVAGRLLLRRRFRSLHSRWRMFVTPENMMCLKVGSMTRDVHASQ